jgi:hypothetical protein
MLNNWLNPLVGAGVLLALLAGCGGSPTPTQMAAPQTATMLANLAITGPEGYRIQTLTAWNLANVDHVTLSLYKQVNGSYVLTSAGKTIANAALGSPITLKNLQMATPYKVLAKAYADAAGNSEIDNIAQAANDTQCSVSFTSPSLVTAASGDNIDNSLQSVSIPIRLMDKSFAGQANAASGVGVTNGTIVNTGSAESF